MKRKERVERYVFNVFIVLNCYYICYWSTAENRLLIVNEILKWACLNLRTLENTNNSLTMTSM